LVENLIDDGRKLVEELLQSGFEVAAAFWLKTSEDYKWRFYIVSPVVDAVGPNQAYRRLHPLVWSRSQPFGIDPLEINLIGVNDPIARDVLAIQRRAPGPHVSFLRWGGTRLGNMSIEEAYFYLLPVTTP
jgi:hypothetical protein